MSEHDNKNILNPMNRLLNILQTESNNTDVSSEKDIDNNKSEKKVKSGQLELFSSTDEHSEK